MLGFIYKDLYVVKSFLIKFFLLFVLPFSILMGASTFTFVGLNDSISSEDALTFGMIPASIYFLFFLLIGWGVSETFTGSDKSLWQSFAVATPCSMKGQIRAKYVTILILNTGLMFLCMIIDAINMMIAGNAAFPLTKLLLVMLCWNLFREAITMPFVWAFGSEYGRKVKMIVLVFICSLGLLYMLYGDVSIFMRHGFAKELLMLLSSKSVTQIVTLLPLGVLGFFYLSYRISLKVYKRGLETCD